MQAEVHCGRCGATFTVDERIAGGVTNCPRCGKATNVPGLRDPLWRLVQFGIVSLAVVALVVGWSQGAALGGAVAGLAVLAAGWLVTRAL